MVHRQASIIGQYVRHLASTQGASDLPDRELLKRFVEQHDESAFQVLLRRHGPMVWRACQRVLHHQHDAEDAFQATFLVLARKAATVPWQESIGSWLYEVAQRLALEARVRSARRRAREKRATKNPAADALAEITGRELLNILDEELVRLPEKYRAPLVLCCLEGNSGEQAARRLGCSPSTLRRRLNDGRELLRKQLTRRGVVLSAAGLAATLLMESVASATVPAELSRSTLQAIALSAAGKPIAGAVSAQAAALSEGVLHTMFAAKLKFSMGIVLVLTLLSIGAGSLIHGAVAGPPEGPRQDAAKQDALDPLPGDVESAKQARQDLCGDPLPQGALARLGTSRFRGNRCYFLPDGKRLVRERADNALQIFDVSTGKALVVIRGTDIPDRKEIIGSTIGFTRDGKYLAGVCWEGRCGIWETSTGRLVRWIESARFYS